VEPFTGYIGALLYKVSREVIDESAESEAQWKSHYLLLENFSLSFFQCMVASHVINELA
jgi:hypothetical protein